MPNRLIDLLLCSASLGPLGVLGDRHFHWCFGALNLCTTKTQEGIIAEDAEVAEVRREKDQGWRVIID
jgi:hypothetical protein